MYLVYKPDGQPERRWHVNLNRLPLTELKMIQHATGVKMAMVQQNLMLGDVDAMQALLWVYLRRDHTTLRVDDVTFCLDELQLLQDRDEWAENIAALEDDTDMNPMERAAGLSYARSQLKIAPEAPGKASASPSIPALPEPMADAEPLRPEPAVALMMPPVPVAASMPAPVPSTI